MLIKSGCAALSTERVHLYLRWIRTPPGESWFSLQGQQASREPWHEPCSTGVFTAALAFASPFSVSVFGEIELLGEVMMRMANIWVLPVYQVWSHNSSIKPILWTPVLSEAPDGGWGLEGSKGLSQGLNWRGMSWNHYTGPLPKEWSLFPFFSLWQILPLSPAHPLKS